MWRAMAFLLPLVPFATGSTFGQELTLTVEFVIYDCTNHQALFQQYMDPAQGKHDQRHEVALKIRQEVPIRDSMKCQQLIRVDQTTMHVSEAGFQEMRFIATAGAQTEDGRYPLELRMACALPPEHGGLSQAGGMHKGPIRLGEMEITGAAAAWKANGAARKFEGELGLWFVTLSEGKPNDGREEAFLEIQPRMRPRAPRPGPNALRARQTLWSSGIFQSLTEREQYLYGKQAPG